MIVRHFYRSLGELHNPVVVLLKPGDGADPHGRAVVEAVVGTSIVVMNPAEKTVAIARRVIATVLAIFASEVPLVVHQRIGGCDREDRIVSELRVLPKQRKVLAAMVIELIYRADDVTYDCSKHSLVYRDFGA